MREHVNIVLFTWMLSKSSCNSLTARLLRAFSGPRSSAALAPSPACLFWPCWCCAELSRTISNVPRAGCAMAPVLPSMTITLEGS